jgi:undecaprenol kinase
MKPGSGGPTPFHKSFVYAWRGIRHTFALGRNIRVQTVFGIIAILLGFIFHISEGEWLAILVCIGMVCGGECLNTAIEETVDLDCDHMDPKAGAAKDMAAGGVLVASTASLIIGLIIFVPKILVLFGLS